MGQVQGVIQGFLNSGERKWISLEEQQKRFSIHKLADVYLGLGSEHIRHELFDHQIAHLIADYARMDDSWSKACKLFGQESVPAFPEEHMSEIGDPDSVFYFIPAGSLNELEVKIRNYALAFLGLSYSPSCFYILHSYEPYDHLYDSKLQSTSKDAKWVLMKRGFLQGSLRKDYYEQRALAKEEGTTFPSFYTVVKTVLLHNALQLHDSVQEDSDLLVIQAETDEERAMRIRRPLFSPNTYTRVKESCSPIKRFIVGSLDDRLIVNIIDLYNDTPSYRCGLSVVKEF